MSKDNDVSVNSVTERAILIKVHDRDNVAIVANAGGLKAGTQLEDGIVLIRNVPQGHKVALIDIKKR